MAQVKPDCREHYAEALAGLNASIEGCMSGIDCPVPWFTWEQVIAQDIHNVLNQTDLSRPFWIDMTLKKGESVPKWMPMHAVYGPDGLFCYVLGNEKAIGRVQALVALLNANISDFKDHLTDPRSEELIG